MRSWLGVPQRYASNFCEHGYDTAGFLPGMTDKVSVVLNLNPKTTTVKQVKYIKYTAKVGQDNVTNLCSIFSIFKVFWSGHDLF